MTPAATREIAKARYAKAVERHDTRAQHDRWPALNAATHELLKAETQPPKPKPWWWPW